MRQTENRGSFLCFCFDLLDRTLVPFQKVGMFRTAVRTDLPVFYSLICLSAVFAVCDCRRDLDLQLRVSQDRVSLLEIVPAVTEIIRDDAGYFPSFMNIYALFLLNATAPLPVICRRLFACHLIDRDLTGPLQDIGRDLAEFLLCRYHGARIRMRPLKVDRIEFTPCRAQAAADAAVHVDDGSTALQASVRFRSDLVFRECEPQVAERAARRDIP